MKKPRTLPQPVAIGPARLPKELGDRVRLDNGLELTLVSASTKAPLFRASSELWTTAADRPGVFIKVGEWPRGPQAVFDAEEATKRAITAQLIAECLLDLDGWAA